MIMAIQMQLQFMKANMKKRCYFVDLNDSIRSSTFCMQAELIGCTDTISTPAFLFQENTQKRFVATLLLNNKHTDKVPKSRRNQKSSGNIYKETLSKDKQRKAYRSAKINKHKQRQRLTNRVLYSVAVFSQNTNPAERRSFRQPPDRLPSNTLFTTRNIMREQGRKRKRQKLTLGIRDQKYRNDKTCRKRITQREKPYKREEPWQEQTVRTHIYTYL